MVYDTKSLPSVGSTIHQRGTISESRGQSDKAPKRVPKSTSPAKNDDPYGSNER